MATEVHGAETRIEGEVPLAETFGYSTDLRSMTQGQGTFTMEFARYKRLPRNLEEDVIAERKKAAMAGARVRRWGGGTRGERRRMEVVPSPFAALCTSPGRIHSGQDSALRSRYAFSRVASPACQGIKLTITCDRYVGRHGLNPLLLVPNRSGHLTAEL